jgi:hypothetical protein
MVPTATWHNEGVIYCTQNMQSKLKLLVSSAVLISTVHHASFASRMEQANSREHACTVEAVIEFSRRRLISP